MLMYLTVITFRIGVVYSSTQHSPGLLRMSDAVQAGSSLPPQIPPEPKVNAVSERDTLKFGYRCVCVFPPDI